MAKDKQSVQLKAILDKNGISADLNQIQKIVDKYPLKITPTLNQTALKKNAHDVAKQMALEFNKTFQANLSSSDIFKVLETQAEKTSFFSSIMDTWKENLSSKIADMGKSMQVHRLQNFVYLF